MNLIIILGYFLSYVLPSIVFVVWAKFLKGKYGVVMGIANMLYSIIALIALTYRHRDISQLLAFPLLFPLLLAVMGVTCVAGYLLAYFTGELAFFTRRIEGAAFWKSFIWKAAGHPVVIYPALLIVSAVLDSNVLPLILTKV